ncbi:carbohydrate kinase family protein [Nocardioides sp.]|uniref:carbohydrate kinase family protein n=1 Tax=Nocardioides sp. TaxID=35761 RepID=UPI0026203574|nr:sugar kinase [Nocardioides sp.]MDI6910247.1 sugar kinase [Nocardioides sp.]
MSGAEPLDVLVLGELNPDLVLTGGDLTPRFGQVESLVAGSTLTLGSSGAIFAAGCARLGLRTAIAGLVGEDTFGRFVREQLRDFGVATSGIVTDSTVATGLTVILNRGEDRAILTHLGAMAQMTAAQVDTDLLARARHVHVTSYFLQRGLQPGLPGLLEQARRNGSTVSMDTNWDPDERWTDGLREALRHVDVFLPNEAEALAITGATSVAAAAEELGRTVPELVVKLGARGAETWLRGERHQAAAIAVDVRDTTGAGDSFDAGYVHGLLAGLSVDERLRQACVCGALSTRAIGGVGAQPTVDEVASIVRKPAP